MMAAPFIRSRCFDLWTYAYLSLTDDNGVIYIAADGTSSTMAMMTSRIPDVHVGSVCFSNGVLLTSVDGKMVSCGSTSSGTAKAWPGLWA